MNKLNCNFCSSLITRAPLTGLFFIKIEDTFTSVPKKTILLFIKKNELCYILSYFFISGSLKVSKLV